MTNIMHTNEIFTFKVFHPFKVFAMFILFGMLSFASKAYSLTQDEINAQLKIEEIRKQRRANENIAITKLTPEQITYQINLEALRKAIRESRAQGGRDANR